MEWETDRYYNNTNVNGTKISTCSKDRSLLNQEANDTFSYSPSSTVYLQPMVCSESGQA